MIALNTQSDFEQERVPKINRIEFRQTRDLQFYLSSLPERLRPWLNSSPHFVANAFRTEDKPVGIVEPFRMGHREIFIPSGESFGLFPYRNEVWGQFAITSEYKVCVLYTPDDNEGSPLLGSTRQVNFFRVRAATRAGINIEAVEQYINDITQEHNNQSQRIVD